MKPLHAILSIHDVAPHTLQQVEGIIASLPEAAHEHLILLVIPGLRWSDKQLQTLHRWQQRGYLLAGHGWFHKAKRIKSTYHKLHSLFVSRDVAEHLSLDESEVLALMQKNRQWFIDKGFDTPDCYVPPAWALGKISRDALKRSGYRYIETTGGYIDAERGKNKRLPLIGFEADTRLRKYTLLSWNAINARFSSQNRPLRISIHPYDTNYLLGASMSDWLAKVDQFHGYRSLFRQTS